MQIGIPAGFAMTLSFPERVTAWNVAFLRQLVINGPYKWPGAVAVETADGMLVYLNRCSLEVRAECARFAAGWIERAAGERCWRSWGIVVH